METERPKALLMDFSPVDTNGWKRRQYIEVVAYCAEESGRLGRASIQ